MAAAADLTEEERYFFAILQDQSGIDQAEFTWVDETSRDFVFRCYDYQYPWYRDTSKFQIDQCFPAGSLVLTARGHVPIEEVRVGDEVLTHEGRWKPVTHVFDRGEQNFVRLKGYGHPGLTTTPDHEIYTRRYRRRRKVELAEPTWTHAQSMALGDEEHDRWASPTEIPALTLPPIPERYGPGRSNDLREEHLDSIYFWWLVGLYCAEGSVSSSYGKGGKVNRVTFSVHVDELKVVRQHLEFLGFHFNESVNGSVANVVVNSLTLAQYLVELGGKGAAGKRLHPAILGQNRKIRNCVFDGMQFGDGHLREDRCEYATVSRALAFDMRLLSLSLGMHSNVSETRRADTCVIQGRTVNQRTSYCVTSSYPETRKRTIFDGHLAWSRIYGSGQAGRGQAYDLEVADDHSYVVEGVVVHNCGRAIGKSVGMQMRAWAFPFTNPGEEMLLTAPEMIHLDPVTKLVEDRIMSIRMSREFLKMSGTSKGITHRPFEARFRNGSRIVGRIPQKDGKGVKGMHPKKLEMDEGQDYPEPGWVELGETLKYGEEDATWRTHGVSRGVRDRYYKQTQPESGWKVHRITAMHRPDWGAAERMAKAELYGSRDHPDYRRNILGLHGDATSALFVLSRLMECVDQRPESDYNMSEYTHIRINDERLRDAGLPIEAMLDFPVRHKTYERVWVGMDVGMTNHPSEILIFGEDYPQSKAGGHKATLPDMRLKCLARIHLERISSPDQRRVLQAVWNFYRPKAIAMDRTGLGLPIFQEIIESKIPGFSAAMRGYNFSEKIIIGYEDLPEDAAWDDEPEEIKANVLEYSSDMLRLFVDQRQILLPWDVDMLREFQGQTYVISKSSTDAYGKKQFNKGKFHALDAARMAVLGHLQEKIDAMREVASDEPVLDMFLMA